MKEEDFGKLDQDARIAVLGHYATHLRYWGTNLLTIVMALATVILAKDWFIQSGIFELSLSFLVVQATYALSRILYFGEWSSAVLDAQPSASNDGPYISQLHEEVKSRYRTKSLLNYFQYELGQFKPCMAFTISPTVVVWSGVLLLSHKIPMTPLVVLLETLLIIANISCLCLILVNTYMRYKKMKVRSSGEKML